MQKILLTGGTGFLGSHLAKSFVAHGDEVIVLKRSTSSLVRLESCLDQITFYDLEGLDLSIPFKEAGLVNAVIHTATNYGRQGESARYIFEINTAFPLNLLETAISFNTDTFFNTDTILYEYLNNYALSKKQFRDWGKLLSAQKKIRFANLRLEHMFGPGDDLSKFTTHVIRTCLSNVAQLDLTPGEQRRDFIYIDDVVSAYGLILQKASKMDLGFHDIGVGSGHAVTVREFVEMVSRLAQSTTLLNFGTLPYRIHEMMESCANTELLQSMGWACKTTLEEGILKTIGGERSR